MTTQSWQLGKPPMLATLSSRAFSDDGWLVERKLDGVRCIAHRDGERVSLRSRTDKPMDRTYPEVADALHAQPLRRFVVDGEVVVFDGERTSFERLQGRLGVNDERAARLSPLSVSYCLFDLLSLDGRDTTGLPLRDRQALLAEAFDFAGPLRRSIPEPGSRTEEMLTDACARGAEGVVVKRADSPYRSGRSSDWLKFKCVRDQEFVVGGWTSAHGSRTGFGALLVGYHDGVDLVFAGKVGTGFDDRTLARLTTRLAALERDLTPFTRGGPNRPAERDVRWSEPELVAQVGFAEWTRDGKLRHPRFRGLREDKDPAEVVRETR